MIGFSQETCIGLTTLILLTKVIFKPPNDIHLRQYALAQFRNSYHKKSIFYVDIRGQQPRITIPSKKNTSSLGTFTCSSIDNFYTIQNKSIQTSTNIAAYIGIPFNPIQLIISIFLLVWRCNILLIFTRFLWLNDLHQ